MKCLKPYIAPGRMAFPCGQCRPCRINKRRIWTHRIMLESLQHDYSAFVTLTYGDPPAGNSLCPDDLSKFVKRLRYQLGYERIRYFGVGEYGERTERPHYHLAVFGLRPCVGFPVSISRNANGQVERVCKCLSCSNVQTAWKFGHVMVGNLETKSAQYIAGYVTKKLTSMKDERLKGRYPEFARMSLKPGIGAFAIPDIASVMMKYRIEQKGCDVPSVLRHAKTLWPLGRYLRRLLRCQVGLPESAPDEYVEALRAGMLPMFEAADALFPKGMGGLKNQWVQSMVGEFNDQADRNQNAKYAMRKRSL